MTATETALFQPIGTLKGVGQKRSAAYEKLGIQTPYDLLYHIPRQYLDYSHPIPVTETPLQAVSPICVTIQKKMAPQFLRKGLTVYKAIAADDSGTITIVIYNNNYAFEALHIGQTYCMSGKITGNFLRREISSPHCIPAGSTHLIRPIYPLTSGLTGAMIETNMQQALALFQALPADWMPDDLRTAHQLLPLPDALTQIHFPKDTQQMEQARRRLAFDELLQLQLGMCMMKTQTRQETPYPMHAVDLMPFQQALPFSLTEGQQHAIAEIQESLNGSVPMNRLLQGDVGSGKTVVAAAACYIAIQNGLQCALMAPTEILASQHMHTMQAFLAPLGISVALLTGSTPAKEKTAIRRQLADGSLQLLVGTHAIFQKDVQYQKLGLVITDEQHRFGVRQRGILAGKANNPHLLVMSATPIPRTLGLLMYGDLDISGGAVKPYPIKDTLHVVSTDPELKYAFRELGTFGLRLRVDNGETIRYKYFVLQIDTEFSEGITVLSRDGDGKGRISFMRTLTKEEINTGKVPMFRTDIMELINPQTKMEDVTDMVQVNNRLLVCSGEEGRIYNMDSRTFDVEGMTSFKELYPGCAFVKFAGVSANNNIYLVSRDRRV